jgi:predicted dinucleotide-binding enzyme
MVTIAVIGGTGSVGKTIVDAFLAEGTHEVIVITRKVRNPRLITSSETCVLINIQVPKGQSPAKVLAVDYANVDQLTKTLEKNNIYTVISTIVMYDPAAAQAERNFIAAADKSACTKRFVASNWGNATPEDPYVSLFLFPLFLNSRLRF